MNPRLLLPATLSALFFCLTGCATFKDSELGRIRESGVSPRVYHKMEAGRELTPEDVIELTRRHVPDPYILRQIDDTGVDYVLSPQDQKRLRQAHVSPPVIDALVNASADFSERYAAPRHSVYFTGPYAYPYGYGYGYPYYDDYYFGRPYPLGIGIYGGRGYGHGHGDHHHR